MTPDQFVAAACESVQALTDDGDQLHRRAARGRGLVVHVHGWDGWASQHPAPGGTTAASGGRRVSLRIEGQSVDHAVVLLPSTAAAQAFAGNVAAILAAGVVPVPGERHEQKKRGRKPISPTGEVKTTNINYRATPAEKLKFNALGGPKWFAVTLDAAKLAKEKK